MKGVTDPAAYEAWYHAPRGRWIGDREFILLQTLLGAGRSGSLLDVGCGTGHFSRRFARLGLSVTGIDPDPEALEFAQKRGNGIHYVEGNALDLPFPGAAFDYTIAVTSLCFIDDPAKVLGEMWRVTRHTVVLGLLNRHSLLYWQKHGRGSYASARWDTARKVLGEWMPLLAPTPAKVEVRSAIFLPGGTRVARWGERWLPGTLLWGGFLGLGMSKQVDE